MKESELTKATEAIEDAGEFVAKKVQDVSRSTFARFPIVFTMLTTFGLVATLYGFEKVIDRIDFFNAYPEVLMLIGLIILAGTGTLYKKLR